MKWITTDSSTNQMGRRLSECKFEFKEDGKRETIIDLNKYRMEDIENCINSYGYTLFQNHAGNYNISKDNDCKWLIAECLFECDIKP